MSNNAQRSQSRGDPPQPPSISRVSSQATSRPTVPSIETPQTTHSPSTPGFRVPESPRHAGSDTRSAKAAKVAIPRLKRSQENIPEGVTRSGGRHRVNHACEPCRHRKTKCSGERPVCRHCQDFKITCFYADGKRDRVKKQFGSMTEKVADYERFMKDLTNRVDESDAKAIRALLERDAAAGSPDDVDQESVTAMEVDGDSEHGGESEASAGKGSTGALDKTEEDFTREGARDTGFMGKSSEVTWLQRLQQENAYGSPDNREEQTDFRRRTGGAAPLGDDSKETNAIPLPEMKEGFDVQSSSYHLDDLAISTYEAVEPYEIPTPETAHQLFHVYMARVHPSFPIVGRATLSAQFTKYVSGRILNPPKQWLAILNLIFAVGARYSHLIQAEWKGDERDHLIYFTRARILAMNNETIFDHPNLQQIQVMGLMSFYLLCTSQVNRHVPPKLLQRIYTNFSRSWTLCGMAIRSATALGLNMRNESSSLADDLKEIRYRVWWALYTLEHRLCSMTGRPNSILDDYCTTPLPVPLEEDQFRSEDGKVLLKMDKQAGDRNPVSTGATPNPSNTTPSTDRSRSMSKHENSRSPSTQQAQAQADMDWVKNVAPNSSLYFLHLVQLTRVSQRIFHRLYNPSSITGSWSDIQTVIGELDSSVDSWYRNLPPLFDFKRKQRDRDFFEHRMALGFLYYGTKITITRPCLCRLDRKIPNQSSKSLNFNHDQALICIDSAQEMLQLIPDEPNAVGLNRVGPWWSLLHWLVQATSVLMLEMSFRAYHMPENADTIFEASKKAVRWMHALGADSFSARRAWLICNGSLRDAAAKIGREVADLPERAPEGRGSISSQGHSDVSMHSNVASNTFSGSHLPPPNYFTTAQQHNLQLLAPYDPLAGHDQYFSIGHDYDQMQYAQATPAEMEFMNNAYHDDQGQYENNPEQQYN